MKNIDCIIPLYSILEEILIPDIYIYEDFLYLMGEGTKNSPRRTRWLSKNLIHIKLLVWTELQENITFISNFMRNINSILIPIFNGIV